MFYDDDEIGMFGDVEMSYDDMYSCLYQVGEPVPFSAYVSSLRGDMDQSDFYSMVIEMAEEVANSEISAQDIIDGVVDPAVVEVVNYKGEGEGIIIANHEQPIFHGKYNYSRG